MNCLFLVANYKNLIGKFITKRSANGDYKARVYPTLAVFDRPASIGEVTFHDSHGAGPGVRRNAIFVFAVVTANHQPVIVMISIYLKHIKYEIQVQ